MSALAHAGAPLAEARAGCVLVHGRGATAASILGLAAAFGVDGIAYVAPQARGGSWYPHSFLAPLPANQPGLDRGLDAVDAAVAALAAAGIDPERAALGGFSQGACLALEYAARHARPWGAIFAFSGGLIGNGERNAPPPGDKTFRYPGALDGTPVFLGCSDADPHVPAARVERTAEVLRGLGARVDLRLYPGLPHTVVDDEIAAVRALLRVLTE